MIVVRIVIGLLIAAIVVVAAVPLLVLLDLVEGGEGWGLCFGGLGDCRTSYFAGPELAAILVLVLFGLFALLRVAILVHRRLEARSTRASGRLL